VSVAITTDEDRIVTTVTDEGPGIRGDISRIFQRFYTDRPDGEHFGDHSGLGLAISKQIVDAHRGTIAAANREDRSGAVFTVTLPRASVERVQKPRK
jgi:two-component system sensor histidine kinase ChvG